MKLTDEQREEIRQSAAEARRMKDAFIDAQEYANDCEALLSSEQAWKEEVELLRKGKESAERLMFQHSDENLLLRKQLNQAIEVLKWYADERNWQGGELVMSKAEADSGERAEDFLSSLKEDKP